MYLYRRYAHADASVTQSQTKPCVTQSQRKSMACISMKKKLLECSQNCKQRLLASSCLSVCMSARPPARMEQLGCHWEDFHAILCLCIFRKICWENSSFIKPWQE